MNKMLINIISLEKIVYQGEANSINARGTTGELTILPHHTSLICFLKKEI